jgi:hypothetical protein
MDRGNPRNGARSGQGRRGDRDNHGGSALGDTATLVALVAPGKIRGRVLAATLVAGVLRNRRGNVVGDAVPDVADSAGVGVAHEI